MSRARRCGCRTHMLAHTQLSKATSPHRHMYMCTFGNDRCANAQRSSDPNSDEFGQCWPSTVIFFANFGHTRQEFGRSHRRLPDFDRNLTRLFDITVLCVHLSFKLVSSSRSKIRRLLFSNRIDLCKSSCARLLSAQIVFEARMCAGCWTESTSRRCTKPHKGQLPVPSKQTGKHTPKKLPRKIKDATLSIAQISKA